MDLMCVHLVDDRLILKMLGAVRLLSGWCKGFWSGQQVRLLIFILVSNVKKTSGTFYVL